MTMPTTIDSRAAIQSSLVRAWGLEGYARIQRTVRETDVSSDADFQRFYNRFYRVRRNAEWQSSYYAIMEREKANPSMAFGDVLREMRKQGIVKKEDTGKLGDLFKNPYAVPFIALVIFYIGTNVPANSLGQFSTWIGANVVEMPISVVSAIGMVVYPIRAILDFVFMHFVDTPKRMPLFYMGAILYLAGFLMFPIFGASTITYVLTQLLYCIGAAFAFEGILKVWMQECFPTLLRTTANGAIVFASRFSCAVIGFFTAAFITAFGYKIAFLALSAMCLIGFIAAIWCFHGKRYNTFEKEEGQPQEA